MTPQFATFFYLINALGGSSGRVNVGRKFTQMISQATGRPVLHSFVHMPIVGAVIGIG